MSRIAVLGAGNWGTVLSLLLAGKGSEIGLWVYDREQADLMVRTRENPFLPGYVLAPSIAITASVREAVCGADAVIFVVRSEGAMEIAGLLGECLEAGIPVISATKGLIGEACLTMSQVLDSALGARNPVIALSGPNIAGEIAAGVPTATVVASGDYSAARYAQGLLMTPAFRVYTNSDILGVEVAGALKNIIAIAAGICDGLDLGNNTKAALLTRGLAEITRLGLHMGASQATFMGLAGIGDLIVTCASPLSRNHRVGIGLGRGAGLDDVLRAIGQVAEGVPTTRAAHRLAATTGIAMPITQEMHRVLFEGKSPHTAVDDLMSREPKDEVW